jgi:hypothetical protein
VRGGGCAFVACAPLMRSRISIRTICRPRDGALRRKGLACPGQQKAFPRRDLRPSLAKRHPQREEGAGNAGCTTHPLPCVQTKKDAREANTGTPKSSGTPCAMVYGCSVISPANQLFCHRRLRVASQACPLHWRDRTTRLDRTRSRRTSCGATRPSQPTSRLVTNGHHVPRVEAGWAKHNIMFRKTEAKSFWEPEFVASP